MNSMLMQALSDKTRRTRPLTTKPTSKPAARPKATPAQIKKAPAKKSETVEEKNRGGRPPKPDDEKLIQKSIRMTRKQWAKVKKYGGIEWIRKVIDAQ
jgi:hypothetical protein